MRQAWKCLLFATVVLGIGCRVLATTFVVPDDTEFVRKSEGIVTGIVISANTAELDGSIETSYEVALDRVLKGPFHPHTTVRIVSPGGVVGGRFIHVASAAHFNLGDAVLLFLTRHRGAWTPTDMTLGKFTQSTISRGDAVLVRDAEDIVGWDRDGHAHEERIRREAEFLRFIEDVVTGREPEIEYEVEAGDTLASPSGHARERFRPIPDLFPAPAATYSASFYSCPPITRFPGRWETPTMALGLPFLKNATQNAAGLSDGGMSVIQNGVNAWTDDCESQVNVSFGGTSPNLKNHSDGVNIVLFNDPDDHVAGTWNGSGVIALCFSAGTTTHTFDGSTWVSINDSDIVFQDGYAGTEASIEEAMTHEIGHAVGLRHADQHYLKSCTDLGGCAISCTENACDSNVEECATTAIMTAVVSPISASPCKHGTCTLPTRSIREPASA